MLVSTLWLLESVRISFVFRYKTLIIIAGESGDRTWVVRCSEHRTVVRRSSAYPRLRRVMLVMMESTVRKERSLDRSGRITLRLARLLCQVRELSGSIPGPGVFINPLAHSESLCRKAQIEKWSRVNVLCAFTRHEIRSLVAFLSNEVGIDPRAVWFV